MTLTDTQRHSPISSFFQIGLYSQRSCGVWLNPEDAMQWVCDCARRALKNTRYSGLTPRWLSRKRHLQRSRTWVLVRCRMSRTTYDNCSVLPFIKQCICRLANLSNMGAARVFSVTAHRSLGVYIHLTSYDTIRYGRLTCAQKLTRWLA